MSSDTTPIPSMPGPSPVGPPALRRRSRLRGLAGLIGLVGVAALAWTFWPVTPSVHITPLQQAYAAQGVTELSASGYVVAQRRAAIASKGSGRLVELRVREGSRVRSGDLLARLDDADVRANLALSRAGLAHAEALERQAGANAAQARVQQRQADDELRRQRSLAAQRFVSQQALDDARTQADTASSAVLAAQAAQAAAQAGVAQARAQLLVQQVNLSYTEIRAPFDGVVLVKNANLGDLITPFSSAAGSLGAVVTLADLSTLEAEVDVSEAHIGRVRLGQPVEITLDALPGERFGGSVVSIVPTVDRAKATVMTKLRFDTLDPRILPEMSAKASFLSQPVSDRRPRLAVRPEALTAQPPALVWRVSAQGRLQPVPVRVGERLGELVAIEPTQAIEPPLQAGDSMVLQPGDSLRAGLAVRIAPP